MSSYSNKSSGDQKVSSGLGGQYLSFTLGNEEYGIDILKVKEIRGWEEPRPLPETPDYVRGVLDLRGSIVPVIDMRLCFNLEYAECTSTTVTIILSIQLRGRPYTIGIVVDSVSDVLDMQARDIKDAPSLGKKIDTRYILGMVSMDEHVVLLLDVDSLLDPDELVSLGDVTDG